MKLHPYSREIIVGRWRIPYAPAYGWRCSYCHRWFGRHKPWCMIVNPIGWAKRTHRLELPDPNWLRER